jgi:ComF family protein
LQWGRKIAGQARDLLDFFFPPVCGICGRLAESEDRLVCDRCWALIDHLENPYCPECLSFLEKSSHCPICHRKVLPIFSLGYFEPPLKNIIHDLKFAGLKPLARPLGRKLAAFIAERGGFLTLDLVVPVPLHESLAATRGFNQAAEIGSAIAGELGLDINPNAVFCIRKARQQAKLPKEKRLANIKGVFAVNSEVDLEGKNILIIDDVTTTGATLHEIAAVLEWAGAIPAAAAVAATTP